MKGCREAFCGDLDQPKEVQVWHRYANMFEFWDWVVALLDGFGDWTVDDAGDADYFRAMLDGFHQMDEHFRTAPFASNLPC